MPQYMQLLFLTEANKDCLDSHMNAVLNACHHDAISRDGSYNQLFDRLLGEFDVFDSILSSMLKTKYFSLFDHLPVLAKTHCLLRSL